MISINKFLSILVLATAVSGLSPSPAEAKKEFTKGGESAKTELGTNTATLPSGVKTKDIKVGTGPTFKYGDVVWIDYIGWVMPDSKEFDSTFKRGRPYNMVYGGAQVCKGLDEGIKDMKQGGKTVGDDTTRTWLREISIVFGASEFHSQVRGDACPRRLEAAEETGSASERFDGGTRYDTIKNHSSRNIIEDRTKSEIADITTPSPLTVPIIMQTKMPDLDGVRVSTLSDNL